MREGLKPLLKLIRWIALVVTLPLNVALVLLLVIVKLVTMPFDKSRQEEARDFSFEAEALFARFAERHDLTYEVDSGVPIEVCWTFPVQQKLSMPLTLGLQNGDELNFGVGDFWSYFFPFDRVEDDFERVLDAWIAVTQGSR